MSSRTRVVTSAAAAGAIVAGGIAAVTSTQSPQASGETAPVAARHDAAASQGTVHVPKDERAMRLRSRNRVVQRHVTRLSRRLAHQEARLERARRHAAQAHAAAVAPVVAAPSPAYAPAAGANPAPIARSYAPVTHSHTGASGAGSHSPRTHSHTGASGAGHGSGDDGREHDGGGDHEVGGDD
jgi:hypothetical protein